jgi:hypothetical protein
MQPARAPGNGCSLREDITLAAPDRGVTNAPDNLFLLHVPAPVIDNALKSEETK